MKIFKLESSETEYYVMIGKNTGATGLAINYPLNLTLLWIYIEKFGITDAINCVLTTKTIIQKLDTKFQ